MDGQVGGGAKGGGGAAKGGGGVGETMVAPGSGGSVHIQSESFERDPQGYFAGRRESSKEKK
ncbi:hypothetical protein ACJRO7_012147 [Eucalyptus globulus]|uniref:Uncharacterized protein n=1 Tax=Eucalyptus globulus TaxID=34317 RepID=A0ABD3LHJ8_EUCGL